MFMTVLLSLILPVLAGAGILALCWLLPPLRKWNALAHTAFGLALAAGVVASFAAEVGLPYFPPAQRAHWVGVVGVVAAGIAIVLAFLGDSERQRSWPMYEMVSVLVGALVATLPWIAAAIDERPVDKFMFSDTTIADQVAIGVGITLGLLLFDRIVANRHGVTMPLVFTIVFGGLAVLAQEAGWISLTFLSATASGVSFCGAFISRFAGNPSVGRGGLVVALILLTIFPVAGHRQNYADFPWWCWALVLGSPLVLLFLENPLVEKFPPWLQTTIRLVLVAIPVLIGVAVALGAASPDDAGMGGYGDYGS